MVGYCLTEMSDRKENRGQILTDNGTANLALLPLTFDAIAPSLTLLYECDES